MNFFNALRADLTPDLERYVDEILENILSQHFVTSPISNLSRSSSSKCIESSLFLRLHHLRYLHLASCQLLPSNTHNETENSSMFQLPLLNFSHQHQPEFSSYRQETARSISQPLSNQSGTRGILKITAPSLSNLMSTFDSETQTSVASPWITVFPNIHLTQSDRTVLSNLEK